MPGIAGARGVRHFVLGAALIVALLPLAICVAHADPASKPAARPAPSGPTPEAAPTRVLRWKRHPRDGVELAYDTEAGVYAVLGRPAVYWDGERYLRWSRVGWQVTARLDGVWVSLNADAVPSALRNRHGTYAKGVKPAASPAKRAD